MKHFKFLLLLSLSFMGQALSQDWFPLKVGNKWQWLTESITNFEMYGYSIKNTEVVADTIISSKKYYKLSDSDDWFRFSESDQKLFILWDDSEYVNMDYSLPAGSTFQQFTQDNHQLRTVENTSGSYELFDSTSAYKGYVYDFTNGFLNQKYSVGIGGTNNYSEAEIVVSTSYQESIIEAIIFDSLGNPQYYSYHFKPEIIFNPITVATNLNLTLDFQVNHQYTIEAQNPFWHGRSFIDSVVIYSYYESGDSLIINDPLVVYNQENFSNYQTTINLTDSLFKHGFNFYYRIVAKDKGIIPEYDSVPGSGYFMLTYKDTITRVCPWETSISVKIIRILLIHQRELHIQFRIQKK